MDPDPGTGAFPKFKHGPVAGKPGLRQNQNSFVLQKVFPVPFQNMIFQIEKGELNSIKPYYAVYIKPVLFLGVVEAMN